MFGNGEDRYSLDKPINTIFLKNSVVYIYYVHMCTEVMGHTWKGKNSFWESVCPFYYMGPGD